MKRFFQSNCYHREILEESALISTISEGEFGSLYLQTDDRHRRLYLRAIIRSSSE